MKTMMMTLGLAACFFGAGCGMESSPVELVDPSSVEEKDDSAGLTATQAKKVLQAIDDICGDTWCEGDYGWAFKKVVCKFTNKTCTLTTLVTDFGIEEDGTKDLTYWRACKMSDIASYKSMIVTQNGNPTLVDTFYDKVNDCMTKIENSVPARPEQ